MENYLDINKKLWNERAAIHPDTPFYNQQQFIDGKNSLNEIELELLGDVKGLNILHLQCHFGQDSLSLARMGAHVTGIDFSEVAIEKAKSINLLLNKDVEFICADIYQLPEVLSNRKFDIVFTSYGTIGWLPDLSRWARVVSHFLISGGRFIFAEFHPCVWMFDNDFSQITYSYFKQEAIVETETGTYADKEAPVQHQSVTWNHAISEVVSNLLTNDLQLLSLQEFDYSPYNCFNHTIEFAPGKFRIEKFGNKIPMVYSLSAVRK